MDLVSLLIPAVWYMGIANTLCQKDRNIEIKITTICHSIAIIRNVFSLYYNNPAV